VDATSSELLGTLYRTAGPGGGRFGFRRLTLRRVTVVLFLVWASMIGGAAPHTVSATRMAMRILRENIYPFFKTICYCRTSRLDGEKGASGCPRNNSLLSGRSLGIYPEGRYFPERDRSPTASGE
jgi:hypothetical protein